MSTLAADKVRQFRNVAPSVDFPAVANDIIYRGSAVGDSSGTARPAVLADVFMGFCAAKADNTGGAASAIDVCVIPEGEVYLAVTGVASEDDLGATVYFTDDDTFVLTATTTATAIGKVSQWVTGTGCWVFFQAGYKRSI